MENPPQEIYKVLNLVDSVHSPELQKAVIEKYFLPDAALRYPIYCIEPSAESRDLVLGVYQFLRILSPKAKGVIHHVTYDKGQNTLLLDVTRHLHIMYLPFMASHSRMLTRLTLKKQGGLHYIASQEDLMQPDEITSLLFPPLKKGVHILLVFNGLLLCFLARFAQRLGFFRINPEVEKDIKLKRKERKRRKNASGQNEPSPEVEDGQSSKEGGDSAAGEKGVDSKN